MSTNTDSEVPIGFKQVPHIPVNAHIYPAITYSANIDCKAVTFLSSAVISESLLRLYSKPEVYDSLYIKLAIQRMQREALILNDKIEDDTTTPLPTKLWIRILEGTNTSFHLAVQYFAKEPRSNCDRRDWRVKYWYNKACLLVGEDCVMRLGHEKILGNLKILQVGDGAFQLELHEMKQKGCNMEMLKKDNIRAVNCEYIVSSVTLRAGVCSDNFSIEKYVPAEDEKYEEDVVLC